MARKPSSAPVPAPAAATDAARLVGEITPHLSIAHQIGGRVRLKLGVAALNVPSLRNGAGETLRRLLGGLPGVRDIALNPLARSCVVEYDNTLIPDAAWPDLLAGRPTAAAATLLGLLGRAIPYPSDPKEKS